LKDCTFKPLKSTIGSLEDVNCSKVTLNNSKVKEKFFKNLSKAGLKGDKLEVLDKLKAEKELQGCTFQPNVQKDKSIHNPYRDENVSDVIEKSPKKEIFDRLYTSNVKDWVKIEQEKALNELRDCTFSPTINSKHERSRSSSKELIDPYERLF